MNAQWQEFLAQQQAHFDDSQAVTQFEFPELERVLIKHGPVMTSLAHHALLEVSGEQAFEFLQGQLTNDLSEVNEEQAQYSAYCDPQGQVLALFLVFKIGERYLLSFQSDLAQSIEKRLKMFVMRSKVTIRLVSDELIRFGFAGQFADLDIQRRMDTKIKTEMQAHFAKEEGLQDVYIIKVPGPFHRYELFAPIEQAQQAWQKLRLNGDVTNSYDWRLLNIASGIADVQQATSGKHIAQFLNLDKINVINFKKGCFPGQEIIARMHYRGKATKRMLRLHLDEIAELNAGDELVLSDSQDKNYKLSVIQANPDIFEGTLCLAVGNLKSLEHAQGELFTANNNLAKIEPLPYLITEEE